MIRKASSPRFATGFGITAAAGLISLATLYGLGLFYSLGPIETTKHLARIVGSHAFAKLYQHDLTEVDSITQSYWVGESYLKGSSAFPTWGRLERDFPEFRLVDLSSPGKIGVPSPFIYQDPGDEYMDSFLSRYQLLSVLDGASDEYGAMLLLGEWVGSRWDHGTDPVPGGNQVCDPRAVVEAGLKGSRFWCEIAARTTVHLASEIGWLARVITASRDGYEWEHAVAELWSDQFGKWFVIDTDFNVVYESNGIPLSAWELSHDGEVLKKDGRLSARTIGDQKPSLPLVDLLPFYEYIHVDLRSDWCSRSLRPGSPAGGDLATWWTARPSFGPILTAKRKVESRGEFNWAVNTVGIFARSGDRTDADSLDVVLDLVAYSPRFHRFETSIDNNAWQILEGTVWRLKVGPENVLLRARVLNLNGGRGPSSEVRFRIEDSVAGE